MDRHAYNELAHQEPAPLKWQVVQGTPGEPLPRPGAYTVDVVRPRVSKACLQLPPPRLQVRDSLPDTPQSVQALVGLRQVTLQDGQHVALSVLRVAQGLFDLPDLVPNLLAHAGGLACHRGDEEVWIGDPAGHLGPDRILQRIRTHEPAATGALGARPGTAAGVTAHLRTPVVSPGPRHRHAAVGARDEPGEKVVRPWMGVHQAACLGHHFLRSPPECLIEDRRDRYRDPLLACTHAHGVPLARSQVPVQPHAFAVHAIRVERAGVDGVLDDLPDHDPVPSGRSSTRGNAFLRQSVGDPVDPHAFVDEEVEDASHDVRLGGIHHQRLALRVIRVPVRREPRRHLAGLRLLAPAGHGPFADLLLLILGHRPPQGVEQLPFGRVAPLEVDEFEPGAGGFDLLCYEELIGKLARQSVRIVHDDEADRPRPDRSTEG